MEFLVMPTPALEGIPPELKMTIAQFLPPVALKELAKACPSWRILCQMVFLDLRGNEKVAQWLYEMDGELREELFKHARKLSCHASNYPTPYDEDFEKFLMSHLPNFKCLSYLKIWSGEISSHLVHLQFSFASTLKVLELNRCHFSLGALVALLNQFDYLDHLILSWVILFPEDGEQAAQVSHHPKKLTVTECHGPHVLSELSALHLAYEELSFKIYSYCDKDMGLIEDSKASLTCLDLTCPGLYARSLTLFGFNELRLLTIRWHHPEGGHVAEIISSITSQKLQEITFKTSHHDLDRGWGDIENALRELVGRVGNDIQVTLRVFTWGDALDYMNLLQNLPKNYRVVLVKGWTRG